MRLKFAKVFAVIVLGTVSPAPGGRILAQSAATAPRSSVTSSNSASSPLSGADPLGRETPRGTVMGFIRAAQSENYTEAVQYFQPDHSRRPNSQEDDQEIASQLLVIFNQKFGGLLDSISRDSVGRLDDGLPADEEKIGGSPGSGEPFPIYLARLDDEHGRKIWLFDRKTLSQVPTVYDSLRFPRLEKQLPLALVSHRFLSMPLWQWLAILFFVPLALMIARLLSLATYIVRGWFRRRSGGDPLKKEKLWRFGPGTLLLAAILHYQFVYLIGTSILYRQYYRRTILVFLAIAIYWVITRVTRTVAQRIGASLAMRGMLAERSIVSLVRRVLEVVIFLFIGIALLHNLGLNVSPALTGLGIGGLALGLGAQKTFENLFGGVSILFDKALQVGDFCKIGTQMGTVEDIGLRSTKIRTIDRTLVSIPNGTVATATLENFRFREKILCTQILRLRYDMTPEHVRSVLQEVRALLQRHPKVESESARVRVVRFAENSIDTELFLYILERDYNRFLEIQEDLFLQIMDILKKTGAAIALPSQTTLVTKENWIDPEKSRASQSKQKSQNSAET